MQARHPIVVAVLLGAALAACPAAPPEKTLRFEPRTTMTSASSRCQGSTCQCRSLESGEGQGEENVPAGHKRFELRLPRTASPLWVSLGGKVFHKPAEAMEVACFYVDLPPGEHTMTVHGERRDLEIGLQTGLTVYEYGPKVNAWYRSLEFVCGGMGKCTKPAMEAWVAAQRKLPRGVLDPCGSTMIRAASFDGTREERQLPEYVDLDLNLLVKVYAFETYNSPGSSECRAPIKNQ